MKRDIVRLFAPCCIAAVLVAALPLAIRSACAEPYDEAAPSWQHALVVAGPNMQWRMDSPEARRYLGSIVKPRPVYLFFHGSDGTSSVAFLSFLTRYDYLVIAPDSMAWAPQVNQTSIKVPFRRKEIEYAFAQARKQPWADPNRIVVQGQSEGSISLAGVRDIHFAAAVFGGFGCGYLQYSIDLPNDVPVLSIQDPIDPVFTSKNLFSVGTCAGSLKDRPGSYVVEDNKAGHFAAERPTAQPIILKFLKERGLLGEPALAAPMTDTRIKALPKSCRDQIVYHLAGFKPDGTAFNQHSALMFAVAADGGCLWASVSSRKTPEDARSAVAENCGNAVASHIGRTFSACTMVAEDDIVDSHGLDAVVAGLKKPAKR